MNNGGLGGLGGMKAQQQAQPDINALFQMLFGRQADAGALQHYGAMNLNPTDMRNTIGLGAWNSGQDRGMMLQNDPATYLRSWLERAGRDQSRIMGMPFVSGPSNPTTFAPIPGLEGLINKTLSNATATPAPTPVQAVTPEETKGSWSMR